MCWKATVAVCVLAGVAGVVGATPGAAGQSDSPVTFNRDVLPILQQNCQECHRPGEVAPMSLLTYADARPWARSIKTAVLSGEMPPWFAEHGYAPLANDRTLSQHDIQTLVAWVDGGALQGDERNKPAPVDFVDDWRIKPDMIIEMPEAIELPASGTIEYKYMLADATFPEDVWVTAIEMRPGNREVVHHGRVMVRLPGSEWMKDAVPGVAYESGDLLMGSGDNTVLLAKYNPGLDPQEFSRFEAAQFVPKGSDIIFNLHYTAIGKPVSERSKVGLVFAKEPPNKQYFMTGSLSAFNLAIPPGDGNAQVVAETTVTADVEMAFLQPHMHNRGKDYELRLIYPSGEVRTVFKGKFDFNWQLGYEFEKPIPLPRGTRIVGISHFDNSPANRFNPDPTKFVVRGWQSWDEMATGFIGYLIDLDAPDPDNVLKRSGVSLLPRGEAGPTLASVEGLSGLED